MASQHPSPSLGSACGTQHRDTPSLPSAPALSAKCPWTLAVVTVELMTTVLSGRDSPEEAGLRRGVATWFCGIGPASGDGIGCSARNVRVFPFPTALSCM